MSRPTTALLSTLTLLVRPARSAVRWPVESQQRSRRNAMLAATDLTDRRRQTLLVEDHLADYLAAWESRHVAPALSAHG
jgi:hypothetical protein